MKRQLLACCLLCTGTFYFSKAQAPPDENINRVEYNLHPAVVIGQEPAANISERMKQWNVNGVSIAVVDKGAIAWAKGYGLKSADDASGLVDTATLFQCASMGKVLTAVAALHLVKEGKIDLDEDVNNKLIHWKIPENKNTVSKKVSLRMLLSHTAGLKDDYGFAGYEPNKSLPTLIQALDAVPPANNKKKLTIEALPGTERIYSGGGYLIIQQLIEDITGQTFGAYVEENVFKPFGMVHSTYQPYPDSSLHWPVAYAHKDNGRLYSKFRYKIYPEHAAAGPWTTAADLARLIIALQDIKKGQASAVLDKKLVEEMMKAVINSSGLGVNLKGSAQVEGFWHSGNTEGYTGMLFGMIESGQGAVILTNSNKGEWLALEIARSIADVYHWPITLSFLPLPVEQPEKYNGNYRLTAEHFLKVYSDKEKMYFKRDGSGNAFRMYKVAGNHFRIEEKPDNLSFIFEEDAKGTITGLLMYENAGEVIRMVRQTTP